jgi:hypothetical protein
MVDKAYCKDFNLDLAQARKDLANEFKEFSLCCEWLSQCRQTTRVVERSPDSRGLKHIIERWAGIYISQGAVIAAAFFLGIPCRATDTRPYAAIGISRRCPFYQKHKAT